MKRLVVALLGVLTVFCLSGCTAVTNMKVNPDDTVTGTITAYIPVSDCPEKPDDEATKEVYDGVECWVMKGDPETKTQEEIAEEDSTMQIKTGCFYVSAETSTEASSSQNISIPVNTKMVYIVDIGEPVVETNGKILEKGGSVVQFEYNMSSSIDMYAFSARFKDTLSQDTVPPTITGVTDGQILNKIPKITVQDNTILKEFTINGKKVDSFDSTHIVNDVPVDYDYYNNNTSVIKKNSVNIVTATDYRGNVTTVRFIYDTKVPSVKGIKNKKTYKGKKTVYVKDKNGILKVKIGSKKVKITKVKKGKNKGWYKFTIKPKRGTQKVRVYDKAGNYKTLSVKIK